MEEIHHKAQGAAINNHITRVVSVGDRVAYDLEAEVRRVGTLYQY